MILITISKILLTLDLCKKIMEMQSGRKETANKRLHCFNVCQLAVKFANTYKPEKNLRNY